MEYKDILAPSFSGFYYSKWSQLIEDAEESERERLLTEYDFLDEKFVRDKLEPESDWNDKCRQQIATWYAEQYFSLVSEFTGIDFIVKSAKINSPREYNFATDKLLVTVETPMTNEQVFERIRQLMRENYDELKRIVTDNHTSCSGFWSFMSNDVDEWFDLLNEDAHPYLDYMLGYLTHVKAKEAQWARSMDPRDFLDYAIYEAVANSEYLDAPTFVPIWKSDEEEWWALEKQIEETDLRRHIDRTHPVIPGLLDD